MHRYLPLLLPALMLAADVKVEVRNSEVWLVRDGQPTQLTSDGKSKVEAELSPDGNRAAYYEECPQSENCTPAVVILDLEGHRLKSFPVVAGTQACASIFSIAWADDRTIAAECGINPSLSEYIETDISTGKIKRDLLGLYFARSPDGKFVAHAGWIIHFAPPYAQSYYLQIDQTTIYPLPRGSGPVEQKGLADPPQVVKQNGLKYSGIHGFGPELYWAPDSRHIALVDCTFDWTARDERSDNEGAGEISNRRCVVAVVSLTGSVLPSALPDASAAVKLSWADSHTLTFDAGSVKRRLRVP